ncbi:MAG: putative toxin-antitoxin system toxin component, PIN family [Rhodospirillales bacterium]|nr:putative toxin-antitoxin system toxin component, PIN family [Alphaproteobacteria bacterium]MCB9980891.1 putative toxin-antitoxin system toxin component, PIN family [Rhodospirillales bacterium]
MKAVLDTNIFVGALQRHDGVNRAVLKQAFLDDITPLMSEALYSEYQSLMGRGHLFEDSSFNTQEREDFFDDFCSICRWVDVYYRWRPNLRDEADNHVLELAISGGAEMLITWNKKDFRHGNLLLPEIAILTPVEYFRMQRENSVKNH